MSLGTAADIAATFLLFGMLIVHLVQAAALFAVWQVLRGAEQAIQPAATAATDRLEELRLRLQRAYKRRAGTADHRAVDVGRRAGGLVRPERHGRASASIGEAKCVERRHRRRRT
ncbi:MAG: hypothetical protein U0470_05780 [Anaerolineae bacterium]